MENLGKLGVWSFVDYLKVDEAVEYAKQLEEWGYAALWMPEVVGRDPFSMTAYLLANTRKLIFATGIANIYARDPMTMNAIQKTLAEIAPGRFILGIGVSHKNIVSDIRGHDYGKPVATMRNYLEQMGQSAYHSASKNSASPVVIAALRQNMLKLAAEKAAGAHPYFVTPEHTARARELMGPDALLCPEQKVLLETDPAKARAAARKHMAVYMALPNYQNNLKTLGFDESDFADGGSDRLVDAIVAWGDESVLRQRIQAHWDAGADHVCIQPLSVDGSMTPDKKVLELLAPVRP